MYSMQLTLVLLFLNAAWVVNADLYVINPLQGSVCLANVPCTITWLDDGRAPLLPSIGVTTIGLYAGTQLVQTLPPVNVATERSLTFTPDPNAGPDSDSYYISFASTTLKVNGSAYTAYSPFFSLSGMSGSFNSPLPAATSTQAIPSSLTQLPSSSYTSTITVGTLSTSSPQPSTTTSTTATSTTSASPRFTTSVSSSSASSSSSSPPSPTPTSSPSSPAAQSGAGRRITNPALLFPSLLISTFLGMLYS